MCETNISQVTEELADNLTQAREYMKKSKPKAYKKLISFLDKQKQDIFPRVSLLDWAYGFECNFNCSHCGTSCQRGLPWTSGYPGVRM